MALTPGVRHPAGRVVRVAGPLVDLVGLGSGVAMFDVVEVGDARLPGEVVAIEGGTVTAQLYEYTGGVAPGAAAAAIGLPLSAHLGPGLLGGVFDGILRPLVDAPTWLRSGDRGDGVQATFAFRPARQVGERVLPGDAVGTATGEVGVEEAVVVPPGLGGTITWVSGERRASATDVVARTDHGDLRLASIWPVRRARPVARRVDATEPLVTGQRVLDVMFPVAKGSTAAVVGGFGTGKTVLLQQIAKWCDADVIVYVACGERGNELADTIDELGGLEDPRTGRRLVERTVIIANTSNMPVMAREASIYTGMTVAEYFRDQGLDTVLIADSTSRWAEALREFSSRTGELPAEEGFPAGLASALAAFYERAGRVETLGGRQGSVTIVAAVSPPGGDMTEPVTAHTQRFVRSLWTLDRDLAYARHYPAISWRSSFSRDVPAVGAWHARQRRCRMGCSTNAPPVAAGRGRPPRVGRRTGRNRRPSPSGTCGPARGAPDSGGAVAAERAQRQRRRMRPGQAGRPRRCRPRRARPGPGARASRADRRRSSRPQTSGH